MKGFSAVDYLSLLALACHSYIICIMIVHSYMHSGLLRHGGGGGGGGRKYLKNSFPVSIMFNYKICFFPKIEVFVLLNQKANL